MYWHDANAGYSGLNLEVHFPHLYGLQPMRIRKENRREKISASDTIEALLRGRLQIDDSVFYFCFLSIPAHFCPRGRLIAVCGIDRQCMSLSMLARPQSFQPPPPPTPSLGVRRGWPASGALFSHLTIGFLSSVLTVTINNTQSHSFHEPCQGNEEHFGLMRPWLRSCKKMSILRAVHLDW